MLAARFLGRPGLDANGAFVREVVRIIHVLAACCLAVEPSRARIAFKTGSTVAGRTTVVVPGSPAGRKLSVARSALEI